MTRTTSWHGSKVKYVGPKKKRGMVSRSKKSVWNSKVKYVGPKEKSGMVVRRSKESSFGRRKSRRKSRRGKH